MRSARQTTPQRKQDDIGRPQLFRLTSIARPAHIDKLTAGASANARHNLAQSLSAMVLNRPSSDLLHFLLFFSGFPWVIFLHEFDLLTASSVLLDGISCRGGLGYALSIMGAFTSLWKDVVVQFCRCTRMVGVQCLGLIVVMVSPYWAAWRPDLALPCSMEYDAQSTLAAQNCSMELRPSEFARHRLPP
jgi:hypothetical protein